MMKNTRSKESLRGVLLLLSRNGVRPSLFPTLSKSSFHSSNHLSFMGENKPHSYEVAKVKSLNEYYKLNDSLEDEAIITKDIDSFVVPFLDEDDELYRNFNDVITKINSELKKRGIQLDQVDDITEFYSSILDDDIKKMPNLPVKEAVEKMSGILGKNLSGTNKNEIYEQLFANFKEDLKERSLSKFGKFEDTEEMKHLENQINQLRDLSDVDLFDISVAQYEKSKNQKPADEKEFNNAYRRMLQVDRNHNDIARQLLVELSSIVKMKGSLTFPPVLQVDLRRCKNNEEKINLLLWYARNGFLDSNPQDLFGEKKMSKVFDFRGVPEDLNEGEEEEEDDNEEEEELEDAIDESSVGDLYSIMIDVPEEVLAKGNIIEYIENNPHKWLQKSEDNLRESLEILPNEKNPRKGLKEGEKLELKRLEAKVEEAMRIRKIEEETKENLFSLINYRTTSKDELLGRNKRHWKHEIFEFLYQEMRNKVENISSKFGQKTKLYNEAIKDAIANGKLKDAWLIYLAMRNDYQTLPNLSTFNILIAGFTKKEKTLNRAEKLFNELKLPDDLQKKGVFSKLYTPNLFTYQQFIEAYLEFGMIDKFKKMLSYVEKEIVFGRIKKFEFLEGMDKIIREYGTSPKTFEKGYTLLELFVSDYGYSFKNTCNDILIHYLNNSNDLIGTIRMMNKLLKYNYYLDFEPLQLRIVDILIKANQPEEAELFMERLNMKPNLDAYKLLFTGFNKAGNQEKVDHYYSLVTTENSRVMKEKHSEEMRKRELIESMEGSSPTEKVEKYKELNTKKSLKDTINSAHFKEEALANNINVTENRMLDSIGKLGEQDEMFIKGSELNEIRKRFASYDVVLDESVKDMNNFDDIVKLISSQIEKEVSNETDSKVKKAKAESLLMQLLRQLIANHGNKIPPVEKMAQYEEKDFGVKE